MPPGNGGGIESYAITYDTAGPTVLVDIVDGVLSDNDTSSQVIFTFSEAPVGFTERHSGFGRAGAGWRIAGADREPAGLDRDGDGR